MSEQEFSPELTREEVLQRIQDKAAGDGKLSPVDIDANTYVNGLFERVQDGEITDEAAGIALSTITGMVGWQNNSPDQIELQSFELYNSLDSSVEALVHQFLESAKSVSKARCAGEDCRTYEFTQLRKDESVKNIRITRQKVDTEYGTSILYTLEKQHIGEARDDLDEEQLEQIERFGIGYAAATLVAVPIFAVESAFKGVRLLRDSIIPTPRKDSEEN